MRPANLVNIIFWLLLPYFLWQDFSFAGGEQFKSKAKWNLVQKKLIAHSFPKNFINAFKKVYSPDHFQEVCKLNTLLFLKKSDYHGPQVDRKAQLEVQEFVQIHKTVFDQVERKQGVDPHVIAGLLWIESRFGQNQGQFHVPSVFGHLIQLPQSEVRKDLVSAAKEYGIVNKKVRTKIHERTQKKAKWALDELKAIAKIFKSNPTVLTNWKGSFSGAYGIPQFLPSSYLAYAKTFSGKNPANLAMPSDAINSVAVYLKKNGWHKKIKKSHANALFKYNNSKDYATAILDLSNRARLPASDR